MITQPSKLGLQGWASASYRPIMGIIDQAGMRLRRGLDVTRKAEWHLDHCIREIPAKTDGSPVISLVEVHETRMDSERKNMNLKGFLHEIVAVGAQVFANEAHAYPGLAGFRHGSANHSIGKYVRCNPHKQRGVVPVAAEAVLPRHLRPACHHMSRKHPDRYVNELDGCHNVYPRNTLDSIAGMADRQSHYNALIV